MLLSIHTCAIYALEMHVVLVINCSSAPFSSSVVHHMFHHTNPSCGFSSICLVLFHTLRAILLTFPASNRRYRLASSYVFPRCFTIHTAPSRERLSWLGASSGSSRGFTHWRLCRERMLLWVCTVQSPWLRLRAGGAVAVLSGRA